MRSRGGKDFPEVQIAGDEHPAFPLRLREHLPVGHLDEPLFAQMHGVIPLLAKPPGNGGGQPHVDEEPHERLGRDHLLAREPGSVSERLLNVLFLQLRVIV